MLRSLIDLINIASEFYCFIKKIETMTHLLQKKTRKDRNASFWTNRKVNKCRD